MKVSEVAVTEGSTPQQEEVTINCRVDWGNNAARDGDGRDPEFLQLPPPAGNQSN